MWSEHIVSAVSLLIISGKVLIRHEITGVMRKLLLLKLWPIRYLCLWDVIIAYCLKRNILIFSKCTTCIHLYSCKGFPQYWSRLPSMVFTFNFQRSLNKLWRFVLLIKHKITTLIRNWRYLCRWICSECFTLLLLLLDF